MTHVSPLPDPAPASSSRERVKHCLARIADPSGEGARTFLTVWSEQASAAADGLDALRRAGYGTPLDGMPVSVKDLLDVKGEVTRAAARWTMARRPARMHRWWRASGKPGVSSSAAPT